MIFYPSRTPDPGVKKAPDPGSATLFYVDSRHTSTELETTDKTCWESRRDIFGLDNNG
jgi:hypothetical protein